MSTRPALIFTGTTSFIQIYLMLADVSMCVVLKLTGTAAKIMKAPAPAMNLKVINTATWVLPASNAPEMIANIAPFV